MVLQRSCERRIQLKKSKCALFQDDLDSLGVVIDQNGERPSSQKITAVVNMP